MGLMKTRGAHADGYIIQHKLGALARVLILYKQTMVCTLPYKPQPSLP